MDPKVTLENALADLNQIAARDFTGTTERDVRGTCEANLLALAEWIRNGGFAPHTIEGKVWY